MQRNPKKQIGYEKELIMTEHQQHFANTSASMGITPATLRVELLGQWQAYCQKHPCYAHDTPTDDDVAAVVGQMDDDMFRFVTENDSQDVFSNYFLVGDPVWLGDDDHLVNRDCADNWVQQSALEKDVANYSFDDVAHVFVLEHVAARLALLAANGQ